VGLIAKGLMTTGYPVIMDQCCKPRCRKFRFVAEMTGQFVKAVNIVVVGSSIGFTCLLKLKVVS
jgi:hypothetical protein